MTPSLLPLRNSEVFPLNALDFDELASKRGGLLHDVVSTSKRHLNVNVIYDPERDHFDVRPPGEVAGEFRNAWLAANQIIKDGKETISSRARSILDLLCDDSARRRLVVLSRAALSRPFLARHNRAIMRNWQPPLVSDYFLFSGLICGKSDRFESSVQNLPVLNLYNLGAQPGTPYSIFVGLHSFLLLKQGMQWADVKKTLIGVGYPESDISCCERSLLNVEILKALWKDKDSYLPKPSIIAGHWELLREQAYTDNMAVHCAMEWESPEMAGVTNPLDNSQLPTRFAGSLAFLNRVWTAENTIYAHRKDASAQPGVFGDFVKHTLKLRDRDFKSITAYVAKEYYQIRSLVAQESVMAAIRKNPTGLELWKTCLAGCAQLVEESDKKVMEARESR